jgi:hypothetical protein
VTVHGIGFNMVNDIGKEDYLLLSLRMVLKSGIHSVKCTGMKIFPLLLVRTDIEHGVSMVNFIERVDLSPSIPTDVRNSMLKESQNFSSITVTSSLPEVLSHSKEDLREKGRNRRFYFSQSFSTRSERQQSVKEEDCF